jgi:hypothetical protein
MQKDWQHSLITKQYTLKITDVTTTNETSMLLCSKEIVIPGL